MLTLAEYLAPKEEREFESKTGLVPVEGGCAMQFSSRPVDDFSDLPLEKSLFEAIYQDLRRNLVRYIATLPEQLESRQKVRKVVGGADWPPKESFSERLLEGTFHPSQYHSPEMKKAVNDACRIIRTKFKSLTTGEAWGTAEVEAMAEQHTKDIMAQAFNFERNFANARVPANAKLSPLEIQSLIARFRELSSHKPNKSVSTDDLNQRRENELEDMMAMISPDLQEQHFDEAYEAAEYAKKNLLNGMSNTASIWIDYDGAKRPEGLVFSIYNSLIVEDITNGKGVLKPEEIKHFEETNAAFLKVDVMIHALTALLKEENENGLQKELEMRMAILKNRRRSLIEQLIQLRNLVEKRRADQGETGMIFVSQQIRFLPRLDNEHARALKEYSKDSTFNQGEDKEMMAAYLTAKNILSQVSAINEIAQIKTCYGDGEVNAKVGFDPLVPQIMVANTRDPEDLIAIYSELEKIKNEQAIRAAKASNSDAVAKTISVVPLFEDEEMIDSENIRKFLDTLWCFFEYIYPDKEHQKKEFEKTINELFFAGSDSSKRIGQYAALTAIKNVAATVHQFNQENKLNIRIKLGTGETLFRQMGFLDPEGHLPIIRGKILDPQSDLSPEEQEAIKNDQTFLQEKFGPDWQKKLLRNPSGYNWILKRHPWINSFTQQACSREQSFFIDPLRLLTLFKDLEKLHKENFAPDRLEESFAPPKEWEMAAARAESDFYKSVMGDTVGDKEKPQRLAGTAALMEFLTTFQAMVRDRGIARQADDATTYDRLKKMVKVGVNARAISMTAIGNFIFPPALLGKGSMLKKAKQAGNLEKLLPNLPVKEILREMVHFDTFAEDIFKLLAENGMSHISETLQEEWKILSEFKPVLQKELWQQLFEEEDIYINSFTDEEKEHLKKMFVPGTRELLDYKFHSKRTKLLGAAWHQKGRGFIEQALRHLKTGQEFMIDIEKAAEANLSTKTGGQKISDEDLQAEMAVISKIIEKNPEKIADYPKESQEICLKLIRLKGEMQKIEAGISKDDFNQFLKSFAFGRGTLG